MRLKFFTVALTLLSPLVSMSAMAADWADLKLTFVYDGDEIPKRMPINMGEKDAWCEKQHPNAALDETMLVDADTKGIMNVCVYPDRKSNIEESDVYPDLMKQAMADPATLDNLDCIFVPHVFNIVAGGSVVVKNSDQTGHNANFSFFSNNAVNKIIPQGGMVNFPVKDAERAPIPVVCNIHPWMSAYVIVSEVPYVGISDAKGELVIKNLPAGKEISLKVWHENSAGNLDEVMLGGKKVKWKKGVMDVTLKPGMNDMGVVKLTAAQFKSQQ